MVVPLRVSELYALEDIADLSLYGIGSANNGGGTDGAEYILSGSVTAGQYFYVVGTGNEDEFGTFFGIDLTAVGAPLISHQAPCLSMVMTP